jgi:YHS domain-containing protein
MTRARRQRKPQVIRRAIVLVLSCTFGLAGLLTLALPGSSVPATAATTERVVSDRMTGLAMNGIDPVAYFTDAAPVYGSAEHEYRYAGVIWRFCNAGDEAAFIANPDVYMPRYGGYDPIGIGRAVAVPGNPLLWTVFGERLYLFYNEESRDRFMASPDEGVMRADNRWPAVLATLVP